MGLPYLKVEAEEAIKTLDSCIVEGYKTKDIITEEYYSDPGQVESKIATWQLRANDWLKATWSKLEQIFVSQKELFNFRDAQPPFGATSQDVRYIRVVSLLKARIDKLNEYDSYIRNQFDIKVEVIGRDKIVQGTGGSVQITN